MIKKIVEKEFNKSFYDFLFYKLHIYFDIDIVFFILYPVQGISCLGVFLVYCKYCGNPMEMQFHGWWNETMTVKLENVPMFFCHKDDYDEEPQGLDDFIKCFFKSFNPPPPRKNTCYLVDYNDAVKWINDERDEFVLPVALGNVW